MEPKPEISTSKFTPPSEQPVVVVVDVMLRCKLDNQVMPASTALEHQQMHINKGEDPCFIIESSPLQPKKEGSTTSGII
ncbi:hypothetical protein [Acidianus manzaensis]|uniref:Uncharacterized protein n=1 Tax=Acidianus manzaensis TaxID=282676 RepID=A0A1W6JYG4_9CREN|nr:hypothetical protein [Acidianus manzaensis]ARM75287.1 hypothetical protein B6F84_04070 [Acidianus manzaensis]